MEVVGTVMSVAQTLLAALQNAQLKEFTSVFWYKSQLEDLQNTVLTIKAMFEDAERKPTLSAVEQKLFEDLKDAVYEADDLLDEFITRTEQDQLLKADGTFSKKMHSFLHRTNPFGVARKMSKGVENIRKKLDAIIDNKRFAFVHDPEPIRKRRPESCSYVNEVGIIGRGEDLEKIVGMLLDSNDQKDPSFLSIYGIGGLGKTTLAQLVYNHPRVMSEFQLRMWACVADQDQNNLDVKEVLHKTLISTTNHKCDDGCTLDNLQRQIREQLRGKRYLLVLDDVWTEERKQWCDLVQYFVGGPRGSWIVVTTRSEGSAIIIGGQRHKLEGLSEEDSWHLFERTAFGLDKSDPCDDDLDKLGRDIVNGCIGVPLAIRVIGSLLYGQDKSKWQSIKESGLANIRKSNDDIMSILQLSYHHLEPPLKSCFSYCALFPKDFVMRKKMLIDMWIAQDYVVPFHDGQCLEDAGEEYFSILLKRCFFQDIEDDGYGKIKSCKMHDLMRDVAQNVSGKEIRVINSGSVYIHEKVRHCSIPIREYMEHSIDRFHFDNVHLRSCIHLGGGEFVAVKVENYVVERLVSRCRGLRVLDLAGLLMKSIPDSLSTLLHLRYLNLSYNFALEVLPKSISKLYNLRFLKLKACRELKELPRDLSRLIKLRVLDISGCIKLKHMPRGMEKLTCLYRLKYFILGIEGSSVSRKQWFDGLQDVKVPNGLKGELNVHIKCPEFDDTETYIGKGSILRNTEHLNRVVIKFEVEGGGRMDDDGSITLMEILHPHPNLKELGIWKYYGTRMPNWISVLSNLVELHLWGCDQLNEWVGDACRNGMELSQLKFLIISDCRGLTWFPLCSKLELLCLLKFNKNLVFREFGRASTSTSCQKLKEIRIDNVGWINSLPMETFQCLERLHIEFDVEVKKLGEVEKVFQACSSSLRRLVINECPELSGVVSGGLEHLTALEELELLNCVNLELSEVGSMPGPSLLPSLRNMSLACLGRLYYLPYWMRFLTALQTLEIGGCSNLKAMPTWMPKLTSLIELHLVCCSRSMGRRCRNPQGVDWSFIEHIPTIILTSEDTDAETDAKADADTYTDVVFSLERMWFMRMTMEILKQMHTQRRRHPNKSTRSYHLLTKKPQMWQIIRVGSRNISRFKKSSFSPFLEVRNL